MRDYSKVSGKFWTQGTGKSLRGDMQTQIVALYLMTSPHANMIGVFNCPVIYIAHETGSTLEGAKEGLRKLHEGGFCTYDHNTDNVWVHEMARCQIGDELKASDNRVKDIQKQFCNLPSSPIKTGFYDKYSKAFHLPEIGEDNKPLPSPFKAPAKPEAETEAETEVKSIATGKPVCPHQEIIAMYHEILPSCPRIRDWTPARAASLKARWNEGTDRQTLEYWRGLFEYISTIPFLTGKVPSNGRKPFVLSLDWLVKAENFAKVREGRYEDQAA